MPPSSGERELSEDDSDAEEERASRRRHLEIRLDARGAAVGTDEIFSLAQQRAADRGARLRAMPQWLAVAELFGAAAGAATGAQDNDAPPLAVPTAAPPLAVAPKTVPTAAAALPAAAPAPVPSAAPAAAPVATVPDEEPHLAWVHGYRGHDCRHNVAFSADGDAVYPAASVVVLAGVRPGGKRQQRFFRRHTDDVLCLAAHPSRRIFASGQKAFARGGHGRSAPVLVWSIDSLELVTPSCRLRGVHENAVTSVAFSPDGERLLSAGLDTMHSVAVWDWRQGTLLLRQASSLYLT